ncbi:MAG: gamma-glutamyl-gamma-aminobutyrate hydrolase family protein [Gemmatimonadaceae bacterium]
MSPRKAIIAITATSEIVRNVSRVRVNAAYVRAVEQAGALPLVIPPLSAGGDPAALLDVAGGLLLTGGEDVHPSRYGVAPRPESGSPNDDRDSTEISLVLAARQRAMPTLAICRGVQLLNVALGGSLVQDIPTERPGSVDHDPESARDARVHDVEVESHTRLARSLEATELRVNSFHHQALDRVADGFQVSARAPDGIVEGLEWKGSEWWAVGVQWHPEELTDTAESWDRDLFAAFVRQIYVR